MDIQELRIEACTFLTEQTKKLANEKFKSVVQHSTTWLNAQVSILNYLNIFDTETSKLFQDAIELASNFAYQNCGVTNYEK